MESSWHAYGPLLLGTPFLGVSLIPEGGISRVRSPAALGPHRNPGYELTYLLSGEVRWKVVDGPTLHLRGGDMGLTASRVLHHGEFDIIAPCDLLWFVVDPDIPDACAGTPFSRTELCRLAEILEQAGNVSLPAPALLKRLFPLLAEAAHEAKVREGDVLAVSTARTRLLEVFLLMLEALSQGAESRPEGMARRAVIYMETRLEESFSIEEVAAHVGLRPSRFHEVFRQEMGQTPADYLGRLRCAKAREWLQATDMSITEIAFSLGFSSSQYFATRFRHFTGVSPVAYRKRCREKT